MKQRFKTFLKKSPYWVGIVVFGTIMGLSLQFTRAWVEPKVGPPASNVGAPINTSSIDQVKIGGFGTLGDMTANDFYIEKIDKYVTELITTPTETIPLEIDVPDSFCYNLPPVTVGISGWSGAVSIGGGGNCMPGHYLKGNIPSSSKCCPFNASLANTIGKWYQLSSINDPISGNVYSNNWDKIIEDTYVVEGKAATAIRISGSSYADDGGYCYAYWGTGEIHSMRYDGTSGISSVDGVTYATCPFVPAFDFNGTAKLCQQNQNNGNIAEVSKVVNLPIGTVVTLQARHTFGKWDNYVRCNLEFQFN
jgi:hypothetical protein